MRRQINEVEKISRPEWKGTKRQKGQLRFHYVRVGVEKDEKERQKERKKERK